MLNSEIIKNNIFRYNFIRKFVVGKVFEHQSNTFTTYNSARILLQNNVTEIYSCIDLLSKEIDLRKLNNNGKVIFSSTKNYNFESYFDTVISFENFNQKNFTENLEVYFKLLKKNGTLIISVLNKKNKVISNLEKENKFDINFIKEKLSLRFKNIEIYSQRFNERSYEIQKDGFLGKIRKIMAYFLKKIDKNKHIYIKYFQKNVKRVDSFKENKKRGLDNDFIPKKYNDKIQPFFFIIVCTKN